MSWIKYKVEVHQVYSNGQWVNIEPLETRLSDPMGTYNTMEECYRGNIPQYKMVDDPELEPICDDCFDPIYRWHQMDDSNYICEQAIPQYRYVDTLGTMCVACDKYNRAIQQVSYDSGATWTTVDPPVYSATTLVEADCPDCCQHRWHQADASNYACDNANKYYKEVYQVSYDSGVTWSDVYPEQSRRTDTLIEADSYDCGYRTRTFTTAQYCNLFDKCVDEKSQVSRDYGNTWETTATTTTIVEADSPDCIPYADEYFTIEAVESGSFGLYSSYWGKDRSYYYSLDSGETWTKKALSSTTHVNLNAGEKMLLKANILNNLQSDFVSYAKIVASAKYNVRGNIYSLMYQDSFRGETGSKNLYRYFSGQTNLVSAEKLCLPASTLYNGAYREMFVGCTALTTAPLILPARTVGDSCYMEMFNGCKSLTTPPRLPATTLNAYCYSRMFRGCTRLTIAPSLPATTAAGTCYEYMFSNCSGLTTPPELPATTLGWHSYYGMFSGCTSLTTAPELPATALTDSCYYGMFAYCTSLTTAPVLSATTLSDSCYYYMFLGCSSLNYIKCLATDRSATDCTKYWTYDVASSGTFVKNANTTWSTNTSGIPSGWTVEDAT